MTHRQRRTRHLTCSLAVLLVASACGTTASPQVQDVRVDDLAPQVSRLAAEPTATAPPDEDAAFANDPVTPLPSQSSTPNSTTAASPSLTPSTPAPPPPAPPPPVPPPTETAEPTAAPSPQVRWVYTQDYTPFATVGGVTLHHPSRRVEMIGFHESNHEGARQMEVASSAAGPMTMESRGRKAGSQTAADVVVDPDLEIRSPVTGTVKRAGTYTLYCDNLDDYAVFEPDGHPGWEVKILHIDGVRVAAGDRVEAGVTVIAGKPTRLPFTSQVDEFTAEPSWPHTHIEVVDPSIPNEPNGGSGSDDC